MERNTILAIILYALVLFAYQAIFVSPKQAGLSNNSQLNEAQGVSAISNPLPVTAPNNAIETTSVVNKTIDYEIKTTDSDISYTNVGGSLHNVDFIGNRPFPITDVLSVRSLGSAQYTGQKLSNKTVSMIYRDKNLQVAKRYELKDKNFIKVRMEIKNLS